ncbi:hypothetical protein [Alkaliphilus oremlandii]|uniref:Uncharacterized protein n=1 Tax=Alkaliphilus oremlandii (strain OhILAs) TaxID=350688 RepID=A8MHR5_ALKOO|nr:hypothetical protein [Alkaliphilus oremlandii]ABW19347.1 hypothetical protein Clos_1807 [Alkaliphilus oremlandii OhILAs]
MIQRKKPWNLIFLLICILIVIPNWSYGNSAEPPSILIIVPNAPTDLEISMNINNNIVRGRKTDKLIESQYTFYYREIKMAPAYILTIETEDHQYEIPFEKPIIAYNNVYTLDLETQILTIGKLPSRTVLLVSLRIILTFLIEGAIFFMFNFREKASWIAFLIINLMTQGALNLWINSFKPNEYVILALVFAEIIILITEMILFPIWIKEHSKTRTNAYVLISNIASLFVGGYLITILPI